MSNKLKQFKHLITISALAVATSFGNTAKAKTNTGDIKDVIQYPNGTLVIKKGQDANIDGVKTPWMFSGTNGRSAFATTLTQGATNKTDNVVVDETEGKAYVKVGPTAEPITKINGEPISAFIEAPCKSLMREMSTLFARETTKTYNRINYEKLLNKIASLSIDDLSSVGRWSLSPSSYWYKVHNCLNPVPIANGEIYPNLKEDVKSRIIQGITNQYKRIISFPLSNNGIPSTNRTEHILHADTNNTEFQLLATKGGNLYTLTPTNTTSATLKTWSKSAGVYEVSGAPKTYSNFGEFKDSYFDGKELYVLGSSGVFVVNVEEDNPTTTISFQHSISDSTKIIGKGDKVYIENKTWLNKYNGSSLVSTYGVGSQIVGLSLLTNGNVVVCGENGIVTEISNEGMRIPDWIENVPSGVRKIIDNRDKGGDLLYITQKNIGKIR